MSAALAAPQLGGRGFGTAGLDRAAERLRPLSPRLA
jgi:hypothetical protein